MTHRVSLMVLQAGALRMTAADEATWQAAEELLRTLTRTPCSAGWSLTGPERIVSPASLLTCRPSNQPDQCSPRTPSIRIS